MARRDCASRVISAEVEQVFDALVDRSALETWLPPDGMTGKFERFDPTPGGSYRLILTYADDVPDGVSAEDHSAGMTSSLENLADYLRP